MATTTTVPDPEVPARATRRRFTAAEKARILDAYDAASAINGRRFVVENGSIRRCFRIGESNALRERPSHRSAVASLTRMPF